MAQSPTTSTRFSTFSAALIDTARETRWGGTVGVGFEYGFAPNWSVAFEYDHLFMGRQRELQFGHGFGSTDHINQDVDLFTARLNYKFGGQ